jgi:hypothetical protein
MAALKNIFSGIGSMFSTLVSGPKTPATVAPPPPPPVIAAPVLAPEKAAPVEMPDAPSRDNAVTRRAQRRRTAAIQSRGGRQSTILTGGMGDVGSTDRLGG